MDKTERKATAEGYDQLALSELLAIESENKDDVDLLVCIARHHTKSKEYEKSNSYLVRALEIDPFDGWSHLYFGNLLWTLQIYDRALNHFSFGADFLPDVACPQWCLAEVFEDLGDFDRADHHYRKGVEIDPDDTVAREKLERWIADGPNA